MEGLYTGHVSSIYPGYKINFERRVILENKRCNHGNFIEKLFLRIAGDDYGWSQVSSPLRIFEQDNPVNFPTNNVHKSSIKVNWAVLDDTTFQFAFRI